MKRRTPALARGIVAAVALAAALVMVGGASSSPAEPGYDINTLAGKVASLNGTAGLQIRFSAFIQEEAAEPSVLPPASLADHADVRALEPARRHERPGARRDREPGHGGRDTER